MTLGVILSLVLTSSERFVSCFKSLCNPRFSYGRQSVVAEEGDLK